MNYLNTIYGVLVYGKEKAVVSAVVSFALSLLGQVGVNGEMTVKEALTSLGISVLTHASVYYTNNK